MRLSRPVINNCCVHITHRCQEKKYLLGCDIDRKYYQLLLYQVLKLLSKSVLLKNFLFDIMQKNCLILKLSH